MEKMKNTNGLLSRLMNYPILFGLLVVAFFEIELRIVPDITHSYMLSLLFLIASTIAIYAAFNKIRPVKQTNTVKKDGFFHGLMLTCPLWIIGVLSLITFLFTSKNTLTINFVLETMVTALEAGICEEIFFRGLFVGNAMRNKANANHIWKYAIISSVCFGLTHLSNLSYGAGICTTISQIIYATGFGLIFCAVYYRTGSILPTIIAHFLVDFATFLHRGLENGVSVEYALQKDHGFVIGGLIMAVVMLAIDIGYTMFLLRKKKREQIVERIELS